MNTIPEFGLKRENEVQVKGGCGIIYDPETNKFAAGQQENGVYRLFSGGLKDTEETKTGILREIEEESGLYDFSHVEQIAEAITHFYNSLKDSNRAGYAACLLCILNSKNTKPTQLEEHEKFYLIWITAKELRKNWEDHNTNKDYEHWLYFLNKALIRSRYLVFSCR